MQIALFMAIWLLAPLGLAALCRSFSPYALPIAIGTIALACTTISAMLVFEGEGLYRFNTTLTMIYHNKTALMNHAHQLERLGHAYFVLAAITVVISWLGSARSRHWAVFGFAACHACYAFPTMQPILVQDPTTFAGLTVANAFALSNFLHFISGAATMLGSAILTLLVLVSVIQSLTRRKI